MAILINLSSNAALLFFFIIAVILIGLSFNQKDDEVIEHEDYHFDNEEIENENKKDNIIE